MYRQKVIPYKNPVGTMVKTANLRDKIIKNGVGRQAKNLVPKTQVPFKVNIV